VIKDTFAEMFPTLKTSPLISFKFLWIPAKSSEIFHFHFPFVKRIIFQRLWKLKFFGACLYAFPLIDLTRIFKPHIKNKSQARAQ